MTIQFIKGIHDSKCASFDETIHLSTSIGRETTIRYLLKLGFEIFRYNDRAIPMIDVGKDFPLYTFLLIPKSEGFKTDDCWIDFR